MSDLAPTPGVVVAKTLDAVVMPVMARMVYLIPNLASLDVSNTVAEGFAVTGPWSSELHDRPGLRHPVLHRWLFHPQESGGGGVSYLSNMQRKIVYAVGILLLFAAMFPYKRYLQAEAEKKDLGEATIGEVDTGSFVLKLFLLGGFRGMAANVLWTRAIDFQKVQEWDRLKVTVDMITKLQPHFLAIWTFQSWNLTYNVSVEWDAPEDKYEWIKRGIKFVEDGVSKNKKSPDLIWDTAWYYYHKLGFSDESIILRRLFRDDEDESFKTSPIDGNTIYHDNFQLGHDWFVKAVRLVDEGRRGRGWALEDLNEYVDAPTQRKGRPGDLPFRSMPAHAQTRYAIGLEKESMKGVEATFGPRAQDQWRKAYDEWDAFGHYKSRHPQRGPDRRQARPASRSTSTTTRSATPRPTSSSTRTQQYWSDRWADQMNYPYWKDRCAAEMTADGTAARRLFYEGTKAYKSADFAQAVEKFRDGLKIWERLLERHEPYRPDDLNKKDTGLIMKRYARACQQSQVDLPKDTPFLDLLKAYENDTSKDPFDALEMLDTPTTSGSKPKPTLTPPATRTGSTGRGGPRRPPLSFRTPKCHPVARPAGPAYDGRMTRGCRPGAVRGSGAAPGRSRQARTGSTLHDHRRRRPPDHPGRAQPRLRRRLHVLRPDPRQARQRRPPVRPPARRHRDPQPPGPRRRAGSLGDQHPRLRLPRRPLRPARLGVQHGRPLRPQADRPRADDPRPGQGKTIAIPGTLTTAYLTLQLCLGKDVKVEVMPFDQILPAVAEGRADVGLIIHEGQLFYQDQGLHQIVDLGQWWQEQTGLPLPLGGNVVRRDLGAETIDRGRRA